MRRLEAWTLQYVLVQPLLACLHLATHQPYHHGDDGSQSASYTHAHNTYGSSSSSSSSSDGSTWLGSWSDGLWQWLLSSDGEVWVTRVSVVASLVSTTFSLSALVGFYHTFEQVVQGRACACRCTPFWHIAFAYIDTIFLCSSKCLRHPIRGCSFFFFSLQTNFVFLFCIVLLVSNRS